MTKIDWCQQLDYSNVLIKPKRSSLYSRSLVDLNTTVDFKNTKSKTTWTGIPIIAANMDTTGTFEMYQSLSPQKLITAFHKFYTAEDFITFDNTCHLDPELFMVSTGISNKDFNNLNSILASVTCKWVCVDIANGYIKQLGDFCVKLRSKYPDIRIVAGNVASREMVEELIINCGVDIVKIGIGPGSACTTRLKTGVGVPQLTAVMECADAAHGLGGGIIADGGITCPGDVSKAFGAGADFVMIGGQFAGHDESPGDIIERNGKRFKSFYGMSSSKAMETHYGGKNVYRASEGRELLIPYKGSIVTTLEDYLGGIRSTCTYIGAKQLKDIAKCTTFGLVSQQVNMSLIS